MSRLRRYLLPLLILLPLVFICGKLLLTPVPRSVIVGFAHPGGPMFKDVPERGWPWVYQHIDGHDWSLNGWLLLADLVVLFAILAACWFVLLWWWRRNNYRFRFSLRACLLLMIVPALCLGWWMSHVRSWRAERQHLAPCEEFADFSTQYIGFDWLYRFCSVEQLTIFDRAHAMSINEFIHDGALTEHEAAAVLAAIPHLPYLNSIDLEVAAESVAKDGTKQLSPIITPSSVSDPSIFDQIERFCFVTDDDEPFMERDYRPFDYYYDGKDKFNEYANDKTLKVLGQLRRMKSLNLRECNVTDAGLAHLSSCRALEAVNLANTRVSDVGLRQLPVGQLRELTLHRCKITDAGMAHLAHCRELESLNLAYSQITTAGLTHLLHLQKLKHLHLKFTAMTDDAIETIVKLRSLEELDLSGCSALTGHNLLRLLDIPSLVKVELPNLPEEVEETRKRLDETLIERWYKRMEID